MRKARKEEEMGNCACLTRRQLASTAARNRPSKTNGGEEAVEETNSQSQRNGNGNGRRSPSLNNLSSQSSCSNANLNQRGDHNRSSSSNYLNNLIMNNDLSEYMPPTGKNRRLKKDFFKYFKIDKKINEKQLQAKRDEFWDTAPVFDGKPEIWSALKAAVDACEAQNFQLAQAIIDSANIILPNGLLNDCYDELGNRYQLPIYVIAKPLQIVGSRNGGGGDSKCGNDKDSLSGADESVSHGTQSQSKSDKKTSKKSNRSGASGTGGGFKFKKSSSKKSASANRRKSDKKRRNAADDDELDDQDDEANHQTAAGPQEEASFPIKLRLSTHSDENDVKFDVYPSQRVLELKAKVKEAFNIEPSDQKMYFGGKQLHDKDRLKAYRLKENIVVQVIVSRQSGGQIQSEL